MLIEGTLNTQRRILHNPNVMWREEDEALAEARDGLERGEDVGDVGTAVLFSGGSMLSVNYLGMEIWKLCNQRTVEEVVAVLLREFEVEEAVLREDVLAFVAELAQKGFITYE